jgi:hypothetical protein
MSLAIFGNPLCKARPIKWEHNKCVENSNVIVASESRPVFQQPQQQQREACLRRQQQNKKKEATKHVKKKTYLVFLLQFLKATASRRQTTPAC